MFGKSKQQEQIDFHAWEREAQAINARRDTQLKAIIARDTEYQQEVCARGGDMTSSPTDEAGAAAERVRQNHGAELATFARGKSVIFEPELQRLTQEALAAAHVAAEAMGRLINFEHNLAEFSRRAGLPARTSVADQELPVRVREFDTRVTRQTAAATVAPRVARTPVAVPDFQALAR